LNNLLQRVRTTDLKAQDWLIAKLRFANRSGLGEDISQTMSRKRFTLTPVQLNVSIEPSLDFYPNSVANLSVSLLADPIAFPVKIQVW